MNVFSIYNLFFLGFNLNFLVRNFLVFFIMEFFRRVIFCILVNFIKN